jgi:prefoldin subunit 5
VLSHDQIARLTALGEPREREPGEELVSPGDTVFAVGEVRRSSMKRVAAAVGEGASAVLSVHRALAEHVAHTAAHPRRSK